MCWICRWLSKDLEAAFEPTPFAILEQHLMHLVDPHYSRRLWSFLMGLTAARAGITVRIYAWVCA